MPLVHIYLTEGKTQAQIASICNGIHQALQETWHIPEHDRFQIIHSMFQKHLMIDKVMWDVNRSDDILVLNNISSPRTRKMKLEFYQRLPEILEENANVRSEDIFVSIVTNTPEDWSFGNGKAQLIDLG